MEAFVEKWKLLDCYGAKNYPEQTRRRLMEIGYIFYEDVRLLDYEQSFEITLESLKRENKIILEIAKVIKEIFPEIKLYKAIAKELYKLLDSTARLRRLNIIFKND